MYEPPGPYKALGGISEESGLSGLDFLIFIPPILFALTIHEFAHAWLADRLGDPTPRSMGRLTLNPLPHIDPMGALVLLLVHFGWGKPVMINPLNFKDPKRGEMLVALAGPASNFVAAMVLGVAYRILSPAAAGGPAWMEISVAMLYGAVWVNLALAAFNMLPIFPLDGSKVLMGLLPLKHAYEFSNLERVGPILLLGLIMIGWMSGFSPIWAVIGPFVTGFSRLFAGA